MNTSKLRLETEERLHRVAHAGTAAATDSRLSTLVHWASTPERFPVVVSHMAGTLWMLGTAVPDVMAELAADAGGLPPAAGPVLDALRTAVAHGDEETFVAGLLVIYATQPHPVAELLAGVVTLSTVLRVVLGGWPRGPALG